MATHTKAFLTPEQYLEIERKAEFKSEYFQGEMFAMAGARSRGGADGRFSAESQRVGGRRR